MTSDCMLLLSSSVIHEGGDQFMKPCPRLMQSLGTLTGLLDQPARTHAEAVMSC
jgi:hypothetical protein